MEKVYQCVVCDLEYGAKEILLDHYKESGHAKILASLFAEKEEEVNNIMSDQQETSQCSSYNMISQRHFTPLVNNDKYLKEFLFCDSFMTKEQCYYTSHSKDFLKIKLFQLFTNQFKCFKCDFETTELDVIQNHLEEQNDFIESTFHFCCNDCSGPEYNSDNLNNVKEHHLKLKHDNWKLIYKNDLVNSTSLKMGNNTSLKFQCNFCQIWLCSFQTYQFHVKQQHHHRHDVNLDSNTQQIIGVKLSTEVPTSKTNVVVKEKNNNPSFYRCYKCTKSKNFQYKFSVKRHFAHSHGDLDEKFDEDQVIIIELTDNLRKIPMTIEAFQCNLCPAVFSFKFNVKRHFHTIHPDKEWDVSKINNLKFKCYACQSGFDNYYGLETHFEQSHPEKSLNLEKVYLGDTQTTAATFQPVKRKIRLTKSYEYPKTVVDDCDKKDNSKKSNTYPEREVSSVVESDKKNPMTIEGFQCNLCPSVFSFKFNIKPHFQKIHPDQEYDVTKISKIKFQCYACQRGYFNFYSLETHFEQTHPEQILNPEKVYLGDTQSTAASFQSVKKKILRHSIDPESDVPSVVVSDKKQNEENNELLLCQYCPGFWTFSEARLAKHCKTKAHIIRGLDTSLTLENEEEMKKNIVQQASGSGSGNATSKEVNKSDYETKRVKLKRTNPGENEESPHAKRNPSLLYDSSSHDLSWSTLPEPSISGQLICKKCEKIFATAENLETHDCVIVYKCRHCHFEGKTAKSLNIHQGISKKCNPVKIKSSKPLEKGTQSPTSTSTQWPKWPDYSSSNEEKTTLKCQWCSFVGMNRKSVAAHQNRCALRKDFKEKEKTNIPSNSGKDEEISLKEDMETKEMIDDIIEDFLDPPYQVDKVSTNEENAVAGASIGRKEDSSKVEDKPELSLVESKAFVATRMRQPPAKHSPGLFPVQVRYQAKKQQASDNGDNNKTVHAHNFLIPDFDTTDQVVDFESPPTKVGSNDLDRAQVDQLLDETDSKFIFSCVLSKECKEIFASVQEMENHVLNDHFNHKLTRVDINELLLNKYTKEFDRLGTFKSWKYMFISPKKLADAGFIYTGRKDDVQCAFCAGIIGNWEEEDDPMREHKKSFPKCAYVKKYPRHNFLSSDFDCATTTVKAEDFRSPTKTVEHDDIDTQIDHLLDDVDDSKIYRCVISNECKATFKSDQDLENHVLNDHSNHKLTRVDINELLLSNYKDESNRLCTFKRWQDMFISPKKLANAGFVYTGREDYVQCVFCAGIIGNWEEEDDPMREHKKLFPKCAYVIKYPRTCKDENIGHIFRKLAKDFMKGKNSIGGDSSSPRNSNGSELENDDGANQQSDPTEMEENSNLNDRPQISGQNSVKSIDELLQPLASSTMIGDDLTMIGKSVENDLNSSTQKAPINTNDQDLVPVNNLVEEDICQPTSNLNDVLNNIDSNHGKPNNKNVSALSQLNRYPASEDVDKENKAAATSVIHSSNVENIGSASMQDNAMDFTIGEDFSEDITELEVPEHGISVLSRHTIDSSIEDNMLDISLNLSANSENSGYFCKLCNYRTESETVYVRHQTQAMHLKKEKRLKTLQKNYSLSEKKLKKFRCPDCNLTSFHRDVIRVHRKQSHTTSLENSTAKSSSTVQHANPVFPDVEMEKKFYCSFCPFKVDTMTKLLNHNEEHHTSK